MVYKTHTATSASLSLLPVFLPKDINPFIGMPIDVFLIMFSVIFIFSLLPDLDEPGSFLSQKFPFYFVSFFLSLFTTHRGLTHNFIFSIVFFLFLYAVTLPIHHIEWFHTIFFVAFISYIGHIIGDSMTIGGIKRAFYPFSKSTFWIIPKSLRFKTQSLFESFLLLFILTFLSFEIYYFFMINNTFNKLLSL